MKNKEQLNSQTEDNDQANVSLLRGISGLWLIPLVTILVGVWMVYDNWTSQGTLVTIKFNSAEGLEAGKTKIKRRNIEVGHVVSISLTKNLNGVLVRARMDQSVRRYLTDDSRFWVVQATIGLSGISGLGTLLSGQYIEFSPGSSKSRSNYFEALNQPPLTPPGTPGLHLTLNSADNFSYGEGDSILYKGFRVGKIEDIYFNSTERMMYYNVFIEAPYHELVTTNTRFWDVSGVRAEVTSEGVAIQTAGLQALVVGGLAFGLPVGEPPGEQVTERHDFFIYPNKKASQEKHYREKISYILMVDDSVSGLHTGAPVMLRGIQVGKVIRPGYIPETGNLLDTNMQIPIHIEINPGRLGLTDDEQGKKLAQQELQQWLEQGMKATTKVRNLLLGQQLVELNFPEEPIETEIRLFDGMAVIPVAKDGISEIADKLAELVNNINAVQFADIGQNLEQLLVDASATMREVKSLASSGESLLSDVQQQSLVKQLNDTLADARVLTQSYSAESPTNRQLRQLLDSMTDAITDLKPLLAELKNKPNSLVFTGRRPAEIEPQRK